MARWLKADGTEEQVNAKGELWTLKELQLLVGGFIEAPPWLEPIRMVWNEEGALHKLPVNDAATAIVRERVQRDGRPLWYLPTIVGDVVLMEDHDRW
jgi:Domain of unknown function (DUF3846)